MVTSQSGTAGDVPLRRRTLSGRTDRPPTFPVTSLDAPNLVRQVDLRFTLSAVLHFLDQPLLESLVPIEVVDP
jgi:hypothetical protein